MEKKQTAVDVLKEHIQDAIEKSVVDNHYESGYKQCLIDIQNKIDDGLLQMEKEQIEMACNQQEFEDIDGLGICETISKGQLYYNETYGETKY
jgi:hypothetical protein